MWGTPLHPGRSLGGVLRKSQDAAARRNLDAALDDFLAQGTTGNLERLRAARARVVQMEQRP